MPALHPGSRLSAGHTSGLHRFVPASVKVIRAPAPVVRRIVGGNGVHDHVGRSRPEGAAPDFQGRVIRKTLPDQGQRGSIQATLPHQMTDRLPQRQRRQHGAHWHDQGEACAQHQHGGHGGQSDLRPQCPAGAGAFPRGRFRPILQIVLIDQKKDHCQNKQAKVKDGGVVDVDTACQADHGRRQHAREQDYIAADHGPRPKDGAPHQSRRQAVFRFIRARDVPGNTLPKYLSLQHPLAHHRADQNQARDLNHAWLHLKGAAGQRKRESQQRQNRGGNCNIHIAHGRADRLHAA